MQFFFIKRIPPFISTEKTPPNSNFFSWLMLIQFISEYIYNAYCFVHKHHERTFLRRKPCYRRKKIPDDDAEDEIISMEVF